MDNFYQRYLQDVGDPFKMVNLADSLERCMRGESANPSSTLYRLVEMPHDTINSIWSEALRRVTPPPPPRPWWRRIWSITPDGRPGGPWR